MAEIKMILEYTKIDDEISKVDVKALPEEPLEALTALLAIIHTATKAIVRGVENEREYFATVAQGIGELVEKMPYDMSALVVEGDGMQ